jgi:hypothetical protein
VLAILEERRVELVLATLKQSACSPVAPTPAHVLAIVRYLEIVRMSFCLQNRRNPAAFTIHSRIVGHSRAHFRKCLAHRSLARPDYREPT